MCTRKGYAAAVGQLALATAALYFKLFKLHSRVKRSVAQPQTIYSEFPYGNIRQEALDRSGYFEYNVMVNGVWRSLVSRLVRVQEASGSNPDTPTKIEYSCPAGVWILYFHIRARYEEMRFYAGAGQCIF